MNKAEKICTREFQLKCSCGDHEHTIMFHYVDDVLLNADNPDNTYFDKFIYVNYGLGAHVGFFGRIKNAIQYVFRLGWYNSYSFGETVIDEDDVEDFRVFLMGYMNYLNSIKRVKNGGEY